MTNKISAKMLIFPFDWVENIVGKGEQIFQTLYLCGSLEVGIMWSYNLFMGQQNSKPPGHSGWIICKNEKFRDKKRLRGTHL